MALIKILLGLGVTAVTGTGAYLTYNHLSNKTESQEKENSPVAVPKVDVQSPSPQDTKLQNPGHSDS